ncbi:MAG: NADPH-dependent 7-cyano-7-deazaguanine reductase QueF [Omnitrophica WOR_2 bacterium GWF2_38_59]|nr:MAG: NADPH-dependent 7-cyano-7-deazaguanine reductase QueF [Omnitrophica WOR_2 bacterium GWF2_38_59]OGX47200.1 MAG: NADPH-dependent 7-cyano-7-deazaguanine reductase QueF [Omnitrophica WOR_2 bacterium RIFOXYA2_FULL_38_17]OGX50662.1 MAG: NADPH-dependent 7-cyano-7-deazaguanine reductase QueF [Omnitrophica WOR_2 bacterium RIFOXYA12_FULL_38_10]OGX57407.1 MAG: NADPH-dependent 7-cyano-7-deazaguanine reductase QueF [Omnitrophica WOR_2 bacterium RIFOXYC2_FULL_38_12]OGX59353.1 MAG: NADPH-dependent 7-c
MEKKKSPYDELQEDIRKIKLPEIEVWENKYQDRDYIVVLDVPEFTCICPKTGLPDFGVIRVEYSPDKVCIELKSFKLYIVAFRDVGIFHEHLVNRIMDDIVKAAKPKWIRVEGVINPRGGIQTTVVAEYKSGSKKK